MFINFDYLQLRTKKYPCSLSTFLTIASNSEKGQPNVETTKVLGIEKGASCSLFYIGCQLLTYKGASSKSFHFLNI